MLPPGPTPPPPRLVRQRGWHLPFLLAALMLLQALALHGTPTANEWREADTDSIARNFLTEPNPLLPRILWGAPGPGYVETECQVYPYAVHLLYRLFGLHFWLGQAVSLLLTAASGAVLYRLTRWLLPHRSALLAVATFGSSFLLVRYAAAFMPDTTSLFFYLLAAERFLAHWRNNRRSPLLAAGAALAVAILIKPTTAHLGCFCTCLVWLRRGLRGVFAPAMLAFGAIALLPGAAFYGWAASLHLRYGNTFGVLSGGDSKWGAPRFWFDPEFYQRLLYFDGWWALGLGGSMLAVVGLWRWRPRSIRSIVMYWFGALLVYYLIVARYASGETAAYHYHIYAVAPGAIAVATGVRAVNAFLVRRGLARRLAMSLALLPAAVMFAHQADRSWRFAQTFPAPLPRLAGEALARVSEANDLAVVTATGPRRVHGVVDNFEDPRVLYYAWRRGRVLPTDELTVAGLRAALAIGAEWLVVLDAARERATPDCLAQIEQMPVAARGDGFVILRAR